jgi:hypothetical protein
MKYQDMQSKENKKNCTGKVKLKIHIYICICIYMEKGDLKVSVEEPVLTAEGKRKITSLGIIMIILPCPTRFIR